VKFAKLSLFFLILFLPTQLGRHFWPEFAFVSGIRVDFLSPTLFFTDILVLIVIFPFFLQKGFIFKNKKNLFLALFFLFYFLLTSFFAQRVLLSFFKLLKLIEFFLLGFYFFKKRPFSQLAVPLSLALFYESLISWGQFFKGGSLGGFFWWLGERSLTLNSLNVALGEFSGRLFLRPYGTFSHPNSLAGFFLVSLILVLKAKNLPTWWKNLIIILGSSVLIVSYSQVVWVTTVVVFIFFLLFNTLKDKSLFLFLFFIFCFLFSIFPSALLSIKVDSLEIVQRVQLIKVALSVFSQKPIFGVGLNNFISVLPHFWHGKFLLLQPVHNLFLLSLAETGILGMIISIWFFLKIFTKALYSKFLFLAVSAIFLTGLLDHYWLTLQQNQLLLVLVSSWAWSLPSKEVK